MAGRFLRAFKPLSRFIPEVNAPERKVGFNEKLFWTAVALVLYLIMTEVPLYRVGLGGGLELTDLRVIFASHRGSLMELGIGPIVTAGLILQLLAGSGIISVDFGDPDERGLFTTATKVFSLVMTGFQASAYIIGGVYGTLDSRVAIVVFIELMMAGLVIMLLDELLQKGWGIGSGISLFIMAGVAQNILWDTFSPIIAPGTTGKSFGAFIALIQTIISGEPIAGAFFRTGDLPTMLGFFTTIVVFIIVIYVEGVRVELPISYAKYRGFRGRYPIKLLYVSNLPVIFASSLFANVYFISQLLWSYNGRPIPGQNFWLDLLGTYTTTANATSPTLTGGLAYFMTSPRSLTGVAAEPLRAFIYTAIMVSFCIVFSLTWIEVGGLGPKTVAKQLLDAGMQVSGFRRSGRTNELLLKRYIPTVTILGGIIVGLIAAVADFFGVFGSGMGVLLSVGILYQYYQLLMQERVVEMYPALRGFLGEG